MPDFCSDDESIIGASQGACVQAARWRCWRGKRRQDEARNLARSSSLPPPPSAAGPSMDPSASLGTAHGFSASAWTPAGLHALGLERRR